MDESLRVGRLKITFFNTHGVSKTVGVESTPDSDEVFNVFDGPRLFGKVQFKRVGVVSEDMAAVIPSFRMNPSPINKLYYDLYPLPFDTQATFENFTRSFFDKLAEMQDLLNSATQPQQRLH